MKEWLVQAVMDLYSGASTIVRTGAAYRRSFDVKVGLYQGPVPSPLLFSIVIDVVTK